MPTSIKTATLIALSSLLAVSCDGLKKKGANATSAADLLQCAQGADMIAVGDTNTRLTYRFVNAPESELEFDINIDSMPSLIFTDLGSVAAASDDPHAAIYTPPAYVQKPVRLMVRAKAAVGEANCVVYVAPAGVNAVMVDPADTVFAAPVMRAFTRTTETTLAQFNFAAVPLITYVTRIFDVSTSTAPFNAANPNNGTIGLSLDGRFYAPVSGEYKLTVFSDDNGELYLDGALATRRDDVSANTSTVTKTLGAGYHSVHINALNAGGGAWAAQLYWRLPNTSNDILIPYSNAR